MENTQTKEVRMVDAIKIIMNNWNRASVMQRAAEMAYYLLLSLVPILLVVANIIPLLPISSAEIISVIESSFPKDVGQMLIPIVTDYMQSSSGGAISIGLLASIWSASNVFSTLRRSLDEVYGASLKKNVVVARILSMLIMIAILFVVTGAVFIFVFGEQILDFMSSFFHIEIPFYNTFLFLRWLILPLILFLVTFIVYQLLPDHHLEYKYSVPGAVFATVGLVLLSQFFSLYSRYLGGDALTNQTLGGFIVLMLFLYLANVILLFGALVNTLTFELKNKQSVPSYESDIHEEEQLKETKWTGYPDENEKTVLKRKLYKINIEEGD